VEQVMI